MNAHVSIAFYGEYRPIHSEAETLEQAVSAMRERVTGPPVETLESLWKEFKRQRKAGISIASASRDDGGMNVFIADYKRNPWLDNTTASFPVSPYERGEA